MDLEASGGRGLQACCRRVCPLTAEIGNIHLAIIETWSAGR